MRISTRLLAIFAAAMMSAGSWQACAAGDKTITSGDLDRIFNSIDHGKWHAVEEETAPLIRRDIPGQKILIARLRYIYIVSIAVQLERRELRYADLAKKLSLVEQKLIIQPWHPVKANGKTCFNLICQDKENPSGLVSVETNNDATQIYSFGYFDMGGPIDISSYDGQNARLGGILDKIDINSNLAKVGEEGPTVTWFFRLHVKEGFIELER